MLIDPNDLDPDVVDLSTLGRDWPLSFRWRSDDAALDHLDLPHHPKLRDACNAVLTEAFLASEAGHAVSYSRRREFYSGLRRYRGNSFTYRTVVPAVDLALSAALLTEERPRPGSRGWQSRFWATAPLMQNFAISFVPHETIILKSCDGKPLPYSDTEITRRMRTELEAINQNLEGIEISLRGPGVARTRRGWIVAGACTPPTPLYLRRIFNRGSFDFGGRAYGWWQGLPSAYRALMSINGEPVLEPDFAHLHCQIIYAQRGVGLIGDAYETGEFPRSFGKAAFNIALNANNRRSAVRAIAEKLKIETGVAAKLLGLILKKHGTIEDMFCSDAGIRLMRIDSDITIEAVKGCFAEGIPVLPVHDSLIAAARHAGFAAEIMQKAFAAAFPKAPRCTVRVKSKNVPTDGVEDGFLVNAA
jgi:hypothetical protein